MDQVWDQVRDNIPNIVAALAILIIGYLLALVISRLVGAAVRRSGVDHRIARLASGPGTTSPVDGALVAQGAVLALAGAMALQQMGFATQIINLAFGLTLGAIAVAAALAFGLGGREVARDQLREWTQDTRAGGGEYPPSAGRS